MKKEFTDELDKRILQDIKRYGSLSKKLARLDQVYNEIKVLEDEWKSLKEQTEGVSLDSNLDSAITLVRDYLDAESK